MEKLQPSDPSWAVGGDPSWAVGGVDYGRGSGARQAEAVHEPMEAHKPHKRGVKAGREQGDFSFYARQAAQDGCLPCLQELVRRRGTIVLCNGGSSGYSAADCAVWGLEHAAADVDVTRWENVLAWITEVFNVPPPPGLPSLEDRHEEAEGGAEFEQSSCPMSNADSPAGFGLQMAEGQRGEEEAELMRRRAKRAKMPWQMPW